MAVQAVRVSKTSFKPWKLHGPIDQALKTSCQADAVKALPLHLDDVHGSPVDLELWINVEEGVPGEDEPNPHAMMIMQYQKLGVSGVEALLSGQGLPAMPMIKGVGVLTGAGATDFPIDQIQCVVPALVGMHHDASE